MVNEQEDRRRISPRFARATSFFIALLGAFLAGARPAAAVISCAGANTFNVPATYATISLAVAAATTTAPAGALCVNINNSATYAEQVRVERWTTNGSSLTIQAAAGQSPVVQPPAGSTAAFRIVNASVNVMGIRIVPSQALTYGVVASSAYVQLSSVSLQDPLGRIWLAGVSVSSWTTISNTSVTVVGAHGYSLAFATMTTIVRSSAQVNGLNAYALNVSSASNNVFNLFFATNSGTAGFLGYGANRNVIVNSTFTTSGAGKYGLYIANSSSNTIMDSYVQGPAGALFVGGSTSTVVGNTDLYATGATGSALALSSGSVSLTLSSSTLVGGSQFAALYFSTRSSGQFYLSSSTVSGARYGVLFDTPTINGSAVSLASMTFYSLTAGATAITISSGAFTATFANLNFADATVAANLNVSRMAAGTQIVMLDADGPRSGSRYSNDPSGYVTAWRNTLLTTGLPPGCAYGLGIAQDGSAQATSLRDVANGLAKALPGTTCLVVEDLATYNEQVTLQGFTFPTGNDTLTFMSDPALLGQPTVSPPAASTAAFHVLNASMTVAGFNVVPVSAQTYGVLASSAYVTVSSVNVQDPTGKIWVAGVSVSSWSTVSFTSVTVVGAHGFLLPYSTMTTISYSSAQSNGLNVYALDVSSAYNNVFSVVYATNSGTAGFLGYGANKNVIAFSSFTTAGAGRVGLYIASSSSNTILGSYVQGPTALFVGGSTGTVVGGSQFVATSAAGQAISLATGSVSLTLSSSTLTGGSQSAALYFSTRSSGQFYISTTVITGARYGVLFDTPTANTSAISFASMTFYSLTAGATAITISSGAITATFANLNFADSTVGANLNVSRMSPGTRITLRDAAGPRSGSRYADDPSGYLVGWSNTLQTTGLPPGCAYGLTIAQDGSAQATSLRDAANGLAKNLPGTTCLVVQDATPYVEQVIVQGFTFPTGGDTLTLMPDPSLSAPPTLAPPTGSLAAFQLLNASVTLAGFNVVPANAVSYGVLASSAYVTISSVSVQDPTGKISVAGVKVSSWAAISYTSVTVVGASGFLVSFSSAVTIAYSSAQAGGASAYALYVSSSDNNLITAFYGRNAGSAGFIGYSSDRNVVEASTFTDTGASGYGLYVANSSSNTIMDSYVQGPTALFVGAATGTVVGNGDFEATSARGQAILVTTGSVSLTLSSSTLTGGSQSAGLYVSTRCSGQFYLSTTVVSGARFGVIFDTPTANTSNISMASMTFYSLAAGATAVTLGNSVVVATFTAMNFADATVAADVNVSRMLAGTRITMQDAAGPRSGSRYADDPSGYIQAWLATLLTAGLPPGCGYGFTIAQDGSAQFTGISDALSGLPAGLPGTTCLVVQDTGVYPEQVLVDGFTFPTSADRLTILSDPALIGQPTVSPPPGAAAAFRLQTASVTLAGVNVVPPNALTYGVFASSAYVTLSSVSVQDSGGKITAAGVRLSSWTTVSYTSVTVAAAHGFELLFATAASVAYSSAQANGASAYALYVSSSDNNLITAFYGRNAGSAGFIGYGSDRNVVEASTFTDTGASGYGLYVANSSSNTIMDSYVQGPTALFVGAATGTVVGNGDFEATSAPGQAILVTTGSVSLTLSSSTLKGGSQSAGLYVSTRCSGQFYLSTTVVTGARFGVIFDTPTANTSDISMASMTFYSLAAGATAVTLGNSVVVATFTAMNFADATIGANVNVSRMLPGTSVIMQDATGPRSGSRYADDPFGYIDAWKVTLLTGGLPPGCAYGFGIAQDGSAQSMSLQDAIGGLPRALPGPTCLVVQDAVTYNEQATIQGFTFAGGNDTLTLMSDPGLASLPTITPPAASTAAFQLLNASVTVMGFNVVPTVAVTYGVVASSAYVTISSVSVQDPTGKIWIAGVRVSSWTDVSQTSVTVAAAHGFLVSFATGATIAYSSAQASGANVFALYVSSSDDNLVRSFYGVNSGGAGFIGYSSDRNVVDASTFTTAGAGKYGLYVANSSSNTILGSYVQGPTALFLGGDTGTVVGGSVFAAVNAFGQGVRASSGCVNLTLSSSTLYGGDSAAGVYLTTGISGGVYLSTVVATSSLFGVQMDTPTPGLALSIASMTFYGLTSGATAVNLSSGVFIATFTALNFADTTVKTNINAFSLGTGSQIVMRATHGPGARQGPYSETDPRGLVFWPDIPPPDLPAIFDVQLSSLALSYGGVSADGYVVEASTKSNFETGTVLSSATPRETSTLAPASLSPNTTYYLRAGALWDSTTIYAAAVVSTPTLSNPPSLGLAQFLSVQLDSVTVAWAAMPKAPPDASSKTCEGYVLEASSDNFGAIAPGGAPIYSSVTYSVFATTLTLSDASTPLDLSTTYYFRVGSLNWSGIPNYKTLSPLNLQLSQSIFSFSVGSIDPGVAFSTVSTSSMVVTNVGNWPVTIELSASTTTAPSSPWVLDTSSGVDRVALLGLWNSGSVGPPASSFQTYLTTYTRVSQSGGNYAGNQHAVQIPVGQSRTLWFLLWLPGSSSTSGPETIQVNARGVYP